MNLYSAFKHLAFKLDAEQVHDLTLNLLSHAPQVSEFFNPLRPTDNLKLKLGQMTWRFPVGLAAGFDKNAQCIKFFEKMGFGAIEVGTITKLAQKGNTKPRIFRHQDIESVRNAMGFPNAGSEQIAKNIQNTNYQDLLLGANIGKNKDTTAEDTPSEYAYLYEMFAPLSDYLVINISSPNTPGLRAFQKKEMLVPILAAVCEKRDHTPKPLFLKIAPDLENDDINMICELSKEFKLSGIVATNTTIQHNFGAGGLSGVYIKEIAKKTRQIVCENLREDPNQIVIGVGGIDCYQDIKEFWQQGGGFVQVYTGYIYKGPQLLHDIAKDLKSDMQRHKCTTLQEFYHQLQH